MEFVDFRFPAQGFSSPLVLWDACHQRAQRVALLLQRLFSHLQAHGPSDATRVTASEVGRYFDEAGPRHHHDEDLDLFPRLRRSLDRQPALLAGRTAEQTVAALERLDSDHARLDDLWQQVRVALRHVAHEAPTPAHCACAEAFVDGFITHHAVEDELIAPVAAALLQPADLAAIGSAMAARRGTTWAVLAAGNGGR